MQNQARQWIERLLRKRSHYRQVFKPSASTEAVLADLRRFTGYGESPAVVSAVRQQVDPVATGIRIGRAEVMARIVQMLNIDDAQLLRLKEQAYDDE